MHGTYSTFSIINLNYLGVEKKRSPISNKTNVKLNSQKLRNKVYR